MSETADDNKRRRDGWVPVFLPQNPGNEWCEWWWRKGAHHELMTPDEAFAAARAGVGQEGVALKAERGTR